MKKQILIFLCLLIIFLLGCGTNPSEVELEQADRSTESLNDVSSGIDDIGNSLDEMERLIMDIPSKDEDEEPSDEEEAQTSESSSEEENQDNSTSGSEEENGASQESEDDQGSQESGEAGESQEEAKSEVEIKNEKINEIWQEVERTIEETHSTWNEYEVEGQKKGATREQLDSFEDSLNNLTIAVEVRDVKRTYNYLSQVYLTLRPIFDLYQDDIMAELTNLKYDTYRAYSIGINNGNDSEFQIFENNDELYSRIRRKLDDEDKNDLIDKLENSITSLKKGLREDSRRVNMIKKNIVLENIEQLQE